MKDNVAAVLTSLQRNAVAHLRWGSARRHAAVFSVPPIKEEPKSSPRQCSRLSSERLRRKPALPLVSAASTVTPRSLCVPGETAAVGALLQYWITDVLPAHGGEETERPQVPPGGRQSR